MLEWRMILVTEPDGEMRKSSPYWKLFQKPGDTVSARLDTAGRWLRAHVHEPTSASESVAPPHIRATRSSSFQNFRSGGPRSRRTS